MIIYYTDNTDRTIVNKNENFDNFEDLKATIPNLDAKLSTKTEYENYMLKTYTYPELSGDNINHQLHQNAETALAKEMVRYENSLFDIHLVTLSAVVPLGSKYVTNVLSLDNKTKYENFQLYRKEYAKTAILRAETYLNEMLSGATSKDALNKAETLKIDITNDKVKLAKEEFTQWLEIEHPTLSTYIDNSANLNYSTFLTEDENE